MHHQKHLKPLLSLRGKPMLCAESHEQQATSDRIKQQAAASIKQQHHSSSNNNGSSTANLPSRFVCKLLEDLVDQVFRMRRHSMHPLILSDFIGQAHLRQRLPDLVPPTHAPGGPTTTLTSPGRTSLACHGNGHFCQDSSFGAASKTRTSNQSRQAGDKLLR